MKLRPENHRGMSSNTESRSGWNLLIPAVLAACGITLLGGCRNPNSTAAYPVAPGAMQPAQPAAGFPVMPAAPTFGQATRVPPPSTGSYAPTNPYNLPSNLPAQPASPVSTQIQPLGSTSYNQTTPNGWNAVGIVPTPSVMGTNPAGAVMPAGAVSPSVPFGGRAVQPANWSTQASPATNRIPPAMDNINRSSSLPGAMKAIDLTQSPPPPGYRSNGYQTNAYQAPGLVPAASLQPGPGFHPATGQGLQPVSPAGFNQPAHYNQPAAYSQPMIRQPSGFSTAGVPQAAEPGRVVATSGASPMPTTRSQPPAVQNPVRPLDSTQQLDWRRPNPQF
ncbi:MAG: hypothetical protein CBB71_03425 [Rhodopirellula sp. TMED11]|nr:MAG: hypothetical protein CBB71_03425 [Rhodopirellula sp. TMED11]